MASIRELYTRDLHNEGVRLPLYDPAWEDTGEWLQILGMDSDAFEAALASEQGRRLADSDKDAKGPKESETDRKRRLIATLVVGWSFDEVCTQSAVIELFRNAPHLLDQVNTAAGRSSFWIQKKRLNSATQPEPDSNLNGS